MFRKIITYLLFISSFLFTILFFLLQGLTINSLSVPGVKITQLYIKLDKKLILDVEELVIKKQSNKKDSIRDIKKIINRLPIYLNYFKTIHIEKLKVDGNEFVIEINDDILFIDNKLLNIAAKPTFTKNRVTLDLYSLYLKDFDILLDGTVMLDYENLKMLFSGKYSRKDLFGALSIKADDKFIDFNVDSNEVKNIHFVKDFISLNPTVEKWMYDNVLGIYKLNNFSGRVSTKTFQPILKSFKGNATVSNAKIRFHDDVDYIKTKKLSVNFENDNLSFGLLKPKYKDIDINGSDVIIYNVSGKGPNIDVNLVTNHRLSQDILDIIKAYGANVPIIQLDGSTNSKLKINVDLKTSNVTTKGIFSLKKPANFKIGNLVFTAKSALVKLNNNKLNIENSSVQYNDNLDAVLDLELDTAVSRGTGIVQIKKFNIKKDDTGIINIENETSNFNVNFSNDVELDFKELLTTVKISDESIDVKMKNLENIYEKSQLLKSFNAKSGTLFLSILNLDDIKFKANVYNLELPLKDDGEYISSLNLEGSIKKDIINANTVDKRISLHMNDKEIDLTLNELDIELDASSSGIDKDIKLEINRANINIKDIYAFDVEKFNMTKNSEGLFFDGNIINLDLPLLDNEKAVKNLDISGNYINEKLYLNSVDNRFKLEVNEENKTFIEIDNYDISYDSNNSENIEDQNIELTGKNSTIIINTRKLLSTNYTLLLKGKKVELNSFYKNSIVKFNQDELGNRTIIANKLNDTIINKFFDTELISGGKVKLAASGKNDALKGKITFKENKIKNLAFINNLILFLNTSPALINPFLVIPTAVNIARKGVSVDGYYIKEGSVDFIYDLDKNIFNAHKINTKGSVVDFNGFAKLDFKNSKIKSTINVAFLKTYTNIVKEIPVINYIFLGDDNKITTKVDIKGKLDKPEYTTNLVEDGAKIPLDVIKRIFNLPKKAIDAITK